MATMQPSILVGLGEVLWDVFPDGARFGGAPANFACTAAALGGDRVEVYVASAVGDDNLGRQALEALRAHGVRTEYVAVVDQPTGQVLVTVDHHGHASYEFATPAAWDLLTRSNEVTELAARASAVCFGTLGQRGAPSQQAIQHFVAATPTACLRILDVNLRTPYWNPDTLRASLNLTNVLKLNDAELPQLAQILGIEGSEQDLLTQLQSLYALRMVALTRGAEGAILCNDKCEMSIQRATYTKVVDTVGAGDAFTAALVIGMLRNLPLDTINRWASSVAAYVCSQPGAAPVLPPPIRHP